jgi:hypothetical protein
MFEVGVLNTELAGFGLFRLADGWSPEVGFDVVVDPVVVVVAVGVVVVVGVGAAAAPRPAGNPNLF